MEIRPGYVLPWLIALGALVNLALTQPRWHLEGFAIFSIQTNNFADYSIEIEDLSVAPIDQDIIYDVRNDAGISTNVNADSESDTQVTIASETLAVEETPTSPLVPTPPVPTLPLPTLPQPTIPELIPPIPTIVDLPNLDLPDLPDPNDLIPDVQLPPFPLSLPYNALDGGR